jgi:hypothetical protein
MPDKIFAESINATGKREALSIIRIDQRKMYVFIEQTKSYMELPFNKDKFTSSDLSMGVVQAKQEKVGEEIVNGYQADKFKITAETMGITATSYQWIAPQFELPVRTETEGVVQEMRNIKPGRPDSSLFELPKGYKRDTQMENMMKAMMGGE